MEDTEDPNGGPEKEAFTVYSSGSTQRTSRDFTERAREYSAWVRTLGDGDGR